MTGAERGVALYLDPPSHHFLGDRLFDRGTNPLSGENVLAPFIHVRDYFAERGVPVHTADRLGHAARGTRNVYVSLGMLGRYREAAARDDTVASGFFAMECPIVDPALYRALPDVAAHVRRVFTWSDAEALEPFVGARLAYERFWWPQSADRVQEPAWSRAERGFLAMINANKLPRLYVNELYTERLRAVAFFERTGEIDLYGKHWDRMPHRVAGAKWVPQVARRARRALWEATQRVAPDPLYAAARRANRGAVDSKLETLSRYRFAVCYENMVCTGWITEKIFDCFFAGTVPVYWGATDVQEWIPPECYVDVRRFVADGEVRCPELRGYLHALSPADVGRYREAARDFLGSPAFERFGMAAFRDHFRRMLREDGGVDV